MNHLEVRRATTRISAQAARLPRVAHGFCEQLRRFPAAAIAGRSKNQGKQEKVRQHGGVAELRNGDTTPEAESA